MRVINSEFKIIIINDRANGIEKKKKLVYHQFNIEPKCISAVLSNATCD